MFTVVMENTDHAGGDQASPIEFVGTTLSLGKSLTYAPNPLFSNPAVNAESTAAESADCLDNRFFSGQNYPDPPTASNELCMPKEHQNLMRMWALETLLENYLQCDVNLWLK